MTSVNGKRRSKVSLLGESTTVASGGRLQVTNPVIARAWASIDSQEASFRENGERERLQETARFELLYRNEYLRTRCISHGSQRYKVRAIHRSNTLMQTLTFDTTLQTD